MNLNEYFPTQVEDASVTEMHQTKTQGSARYVDDNQEVILIPNIRWGIYKKRMQLEYQSGFITTNGRSYEPSSYHRLGLQWKFHDQDDWVPTLALQPQLLYPAGQENKALDPAVKLFLTYTLVGTLADPVGQFHLNYRWIQNTERQENENKVGKQLIFGYAHKLNLNNVIVADFLHQRELYRSEFQSEVELGWIHQIKDDLFLGAGLGMDVELGRFSSNLSAQITF